MVVYLQTRLSVESSVVFAIGDFINNGLTKGRYHIEIAKKLALIGNGSRLKLFASQKAVARKVMEGTVWVLCRFPV